MQATATPTPTGTPPATPPDNVPGSGTDYLNVTLSELTSFMGEALFALFIAGFVFFFLYYASGGRFGVPAIVMTLAGGWLVSEIPVQYQSMVETIILIGIIAGVFAILRRFVLRPSA